VSERARLLVPRGAIEGAAIDGKLRSPVDPARDPKVSQDGLAAVHGIGSRVHGSVPSWWPSAAAPGVTARPYPGWGSRVSAWPTDSSPPPRRDEASEYSTGHTRWCGPNGDAIWRRPGGPRGLERARWSRLTGMAGHAELVPRRGRPEADCGPGAGPDMGQGMQRRVAGLPEVAGRRRGLLTGRVGQGAAHGGRPRRRCKVGGGGPRVGDPSLQRHRPGSGDAPAGAH